MISIEKIKQLREETGVSLSECKKALEGANGDIAKAKEILKSWGEDFAKKRENKEVKKGIIESYVHPGKRIGVLIDIHCESDFVAESEDFQKLAHELCLQIASMNPEPDSLSSQPWVKDETKTIKDLIDEYISKIGENIVVQKFIRFEI